MSSLHVMPVPDSIHSQLNQYMAELQKPSPSDVQPLVFWQKKALDWEPASMAPNPGPDWFQNCHPYL